MSIVSRPLRVGSLVFCLFATLSAPSVRAQATSGNPALEKQLSRIDFGASGIGTFTKDVSGTNTFPGAPVSQHASSTLGALISVRYTKSPYLGGEFNYTYARFTQNYSQYIVGGIQANTSEYTFGYVAHPPHPIFKSKPFLAAGLGTTAFRPTTFGGQSLKSQARMTYYYAVGLDRDISPHFALRAQFRQTFYKAPDFGQNFLTINKQTWTIEPGFGFVVHF